MYPFYCWRRKNLKISVNNKKNIFLSLEKWQITPLNVKSFVLWWEVQKNREINVNTEQREFLSTRYLWFSCFYNRVTLFFRIQRFVKLSPMFPPWPPNGFLVVHQWSSDVPHAPQWFPIVSQMVFHVVAQCPINPLIIMPFPPMFSNHFSVLTDLLMVSIIP